MANLSISTQEYSSSESEPKLDNENKRSPTHVSVDITSVEPQKHRVLHKVPPQVCGTRSDHIYHPVVVSLGPYHHGHPHLRLVEAFKDEAVDIMLNSKDKDLILNKITEWVHEIRDFYESLSTQECDDEALAKIMFRDGCFVLYYMEMCSDDEDNSKYSLLVHRLGQSTAAFMFRDVFMLENQVPLWLIKRLFSLIYDNDDDDREWEGFICRFLSQMNFGDRDRMRKVPWESKLEQEPLHILEAHRTTLLNVNGESATNVHPHHWIPEFLRQKTHRSSSVFETANSQFRSVTELQAKGIRFGPSSNHLTDIKFDSHLFYGKLQLPIWFVTNNSKVFFSNLIAFEMSPGADTDNAMTSYINFMKSLIDGPKDVKELRDKDILFSLLANDEEVVRMFKEIDTYGMDNADIFQDVRRRIDEHCDSRSKTWTAELIHSYFHNPWTAIGLIAAMFLLCLTFLQTYYTINPVKKGQ